MGGLPRRATFISREKEEGIDTLLLDSGNFIASRNLTEPAVEPAAVKARLILEAMERMGYQAIAVGEKDVSVGLDRLKALEDGTDIKFLSANLVDGRGRTIFDPYFLTAAGGVSVGVVGLTSPPADSRAFAARAGDAEVLDPVKAAREAVEKVRSRSGLVVVLSNLGYGKDQELADEVPGIDIIIGGGDRRYMKRPVVRGKTLITSGYFEGRAMGRMVVHLNGPITGWITRKELDFMDRQIEAAGEKLQTPEGKEKLEALTRKRASLELVTVHEPDMVNLGPSIPDDPKTAQMIEDYRISLKEKTAGKTSPAGGGEQVRYTGAQACASCHSARHRFWMTTGHATAFDSLAPKNAEADTDCVPCHVTGYMRRTGYWPKAPREDLRGVQCEACHGIGLLHVNDPESYSLLHLPIAPQCMDCHTEDQDDDFDYFRDKLLVCAEAK